MQSYTDQLGRTFSCTPFPQRIVSLVPSQTELLASLGLDEQVKGITKFCVHPQAWFKNKTRIGGTKNVDVNKVLGLKPDLVLANKEENVREQVEQIDALVPTYVSDVNTLADALHMINDVGIITGKMAEATQLTTSIAKSFGDLQPGDKKISAAYLIWKNPWMTVGSDTFIHDMLQVAGFENVFAQKQRYPAVEIADLQVVQPEVLLLSSEPYPFKEIHIAELQPLLPQTRIVLVDGEMFSWYGSRLLHAPGYFAKLRRSIMNSVF